jgi:hypothetical protein
MENYQSEIAKWTAAAKRIADESQKLSEILRLEFIKSNIDNPQRDQINAIFRAADELYEACKTP